MTQIKQYPINGYNKYVYVDGQNHKHVVYADKQPTYGELIRHYGSEARYWQIER